MQHWYIVSNFEVDYESEEHASIVYKTLAVDKAVFYYYFFLQKITFVHELVQL